MMLALQIVMGLLAFAAFVFTIASFRKQRPLKWWVPLSSIVVALVITPVTMALAGVPQAWVAGLVLGAIGFVLGALWGSTTRIKWVDGVPTGRNSVLWLVFFMLSFGFTYTLMLFAPSAMVTLGALGGSLPAGMGVGTNSNLLVRLLARAGSGGG